MAKNTLAICLMFLVASSVIYEAQGTFLLKLYLKRKLFPRRCIEFTPFACKGMLMLMSNLEGGCPATREFKEFFVKFKAYMDFINSASASENIDVDLTTNCDGLAKAMILLKGGGESSVFKLTMLSMGKTLIEQKRRGSAIMTLSQKKELVMSMVKWTRMLASFVKTASEVKGKSIDISAYGLDVDVNSSVGSGSGSESDESIENGSSTPQSGSTPTPEAESSPTGSTPTPEAGSSPTRESGSQHSGSESTESGNTAYGTSGSTFKDTTGSGSGSPSGSPTGSPSTSTSSGKGEVSGNVASKTKESNSGSSETPFSDTTGITTESPSGSPSTLTSSGKGEVSGNVASKTKESTSGSSETPFSDTTGATMESLSGSPSTLTSSGKGEVSGNVASKTKESTSGSSETPFSDTTGATTESPSGGPTGSPSTSTSSVKENSASQTQESNFVTSSSSATSVKEVESETSKEVMSFISGLEKKYAGKAELKVFFNKLKTSMSASSKISSTDSHNFLYGMSSAVGKLSEAMAFVRSTFGKSAEMKTNMESCQAEFMKTLKEFQAINSQIVTQSQGKTVTATQKTELKQTITKWEQVTTQFVETAASSSSSQQSSASMVKNN